MKMHRMRLITTTNCPFGIEDDETVKGRQAGRQEEERGERRVGRLPQDGLLTWGATLIGWHVILFMQCALSTPDNWVAKLERRARREREVRRASRTRRGARVQRAGNVIVSAHKAIKCLT